MGIENFNTPPAVNIDDIKAQGELELSEVITGKQIEETQEMQKALETGINFDFSGSLGEGFDHDFFADKMATFPYDKLYDSWNLFLAHEGEDLHDRAIEFGTLTTIFNKLTGISNSPLMFPVFIQGVKSYSETQNIPSDHITPERMERFYNSLTGGASSSAESAEESVSESEESEESEDMEDGEGEVHKSV